ncbi:MAG: hypothetical protein ACE5J2_08390 [Nitrososphaerales archaeon]
MERRRKVAITIAGIASALAITAILQIDAASNLEIEMKESQLLSRDGDTSSYLVSLQLTNHRFMLLSVGDIDYTIKVNGEPLGMGTIGPFYLAPYSSMIVDSDFRADNEVRNKYKGKLHDQDVELSASSNYSLYMLSFEIPFSHSPTPAQIEKFVKE